MINRVKIKSLIRERIFEIYEAYSINDISKITNIRQDIYRQLTYKEYKGWVVPLKPFVYKFMDNIFKISYKWNQCTKKEYYKKTVISGNYFKYKSQVNNLDRPARKSKCTLLENIYIEKIDKLKEHEEIQI